MTTNHQNTDEPWTNHIKLAHDFFEIPNNESLKCLSLWRPSQSFAQKKKKKENPKYRK